MHPTDELLALAEWYRVLADVGRPSHRKDRLRWAEHLERQAEQLQPRTMIHAAVAAAAAGVI